MKEFFPDGTEIDKWFYKAPEIPHENKKIFLITDYGATCDGAICTKEIQNTIDEAYKAGGGIVKIPSGTFCCGSIYFKPGVNLYLEKNACLLGSSNICDYPLCKTRIEGESCVYFPALINADQCDGFTIYGEGIIDGNGLESWKRFWLRYSWNPQCTNKDEMRARLVFISNSKNVVLKGVTFRNSQFWTTHFYKCSYVKIFDCDFYSPKEPVKAPSTDAIDLDVCSDVLVKNCHMEVNDDAVALKGGKGWTADKLPDNGSNQRIIIEDCHYGFCHGCLTLGSESVHNKNIILRRIKVDCGFNLLWLKMRPDTPQLYEYILVDGVEGQVDNFINVNPWTQFFDEDGKKEIPVSVARNVTMKNCKVKSINYRNIKECPEQYLLENFSISY